MIENARDRSEPTILTCEVFHYRPKMWVETVAVEKVVAEMNVRNATPSRLDEPVDSLSIEILPKIRTVRGGRRRKPEIHERLLGVVVWHFGAAIEGIEPV